MTPRAAAIFLLAAAAHAGDGPTDRQWINPAGGLFADPANWSPLGVPGPTDRAIFDLAVPAAYAVGFAADATLDRILIGANDITLSLGGTTHTLTNAGDSLFEHALTVGHAAGPASLTLSGGQLRLGSLYAATDPAADAAIHVPGQHSILFCTGDAFIGFAGVGALHVRDSGRALFRALSAGSAFSGAGAINVSDSGSLLFATGALTVGSSGAGSFLAEKGAAVSAFAGILGAAPGSSAVAVIRSGAELSCGLELIVAGAPGGSKGGDASLTIDTGGRVRTVTVRIAPALGARGEVLVTGGGSSLQPQDLLVIGQEPSETDGSPEGFGVLRLEDGGRAVTAAATVNRLGTLAGDGFLTAALTNRGLVAPGTDAALGVLTVTGSFTQPAAPDPFTATARTRVRIGLQQGIPASDRLHVEGHATLGSILEVAVQPGFTPTPGQTFTVLHAAQLQGAFQRFVLAEAPGQWLLRARTVGNSVLIDVLPGRIPGDVNGDGIVNFTDLNIVLGQFGSTQPGLEGDVNGDGVVNFTDLNIVLGNFGQSS